MSSPRNVVFFVALLLSGSLFAAALITDSDLLIGLTFAVGGLDLLFFTPELDDTTGMTDLPKDTGTRHLVLCIAGALLVVMGVFLVIRTL